MKNYESATYEIPQIAELYHAGKGVVISAMHMKLPFLHSPPPSPPPPQKKSTTNFKISFYRPSPLFPNKTRAIYFCYDNVAKRKKVFFDTVEEIAATRKILTRKLYCVEENSNKNVSLIIILVERPKKLICLILCFDYLR